MFENLVNYDKSKTDVFIFANSSRFENLVNYDKSKTLYLLSLHHHLFENLVNYDKCKTCNCRCCILQRATWKLDESELKELKSRVEFFGLDKTDDFNDFKGKYLNATKEVENSEIVLYYFQER